MRTGLYGGSFDPVHNGHIMPVLKAQEQLGLERVLYLPTARPPHKPGRQFAVSRARLVMVEMALLEYPSLQVARYELTPGRTAYTADSVDYFREQFPEDEFFLIIGVDSLVNFTTWRRWQDLVAETQLAVLNRPGWDSKGVRSKLKEPLAELVSAGRVHFVANDPVEISSTKLREIFSRDGEPPEGSVHPQVVKYIRKYSLYR